jgi:hypothetical protein
MTQLQIFALFEIWIKESTSAEAITATFCEKSFSMLM